MTSTQATKSSNAGNSRTLSFSAVDLGKNIDLMLVFEPPQKGKLYTDLFPVCWRVLKFAAGGISNATVEYTADTGLLVPQENTGNLVAASNARRCQTGEMCTVMTNDDGDNYLTAPAQGAPGIIECSVQTAFPATIAFGFFTKDGKKIEPVFKWNGIAKGDTLDVQLTPVLKIYAVSDFKVTEVVKADIHSDILFSEDLISLPKATNWVVSRDKSSKAITIKRE